MYVPPAFAVEDDQALAFAERIGFGALACSGPEGLCAVQLPFMIQRDPLRVIGHVARANPIWRSGGGEGVMIVQGAGAYVSPSYYPSKKEHGRVVPTWNYEAVHLHGVVDWFEGGARLLSVVETLTNHYEQGREQAWAVSDAPAAYVEKLLAAIVGVELRITRIDAARKLSQNKAEPDRQGVINGLSASNDGDRHVAKAMLT